MNQFRRLRVFVCLLGAVFCLFSPLISFAKPICEGEWIDYNENIHPNVNPDVLRFERGKGFLDETDRWLVTKLQQLKDGKGLGVDQRNLVASIYQRTHGIIMKILKRMNVPFDDRADVAHDVFVTLIENIDHWDPSAVGENERKVINWIGGTCRNLVSNYNARRSRFNRSMESEELERGGDLNRPHLNDIGDNRIEFSDPDHAWRIVNSLSDPKDKEIMSRWIEGQEFSQIATEMELTPTEVQLSWSASMVVLREAHRAALAGEVHEVQPKVKNRVSEEGRRRMNAVSEYTSEEIDAAIAKAETTGGPGLRMTANQAILLRAHLLHGMSTAMLSKREGKTMGTISLTLDRAMEKLLPHLTRKAEESVPMVSLDDGTHMPESEVDRILGQTEMDDEMRIIVTGYLFQGRTPTQLSSDLDLSLAQIRDRRKKAMELFYEQRRKERSSEAK